MPTSRRAPSTTSRSPARSRTPTATPWAPMTPGASRRSSPRSPTRRPPTSAPGPPAPTPTSPRPATARSSWRRPWARSSRAGPAFPPDGRASRGSPPAGSATVSNGQARGRWRQRRDRGDLRVGARARVQRHVRRRELRARRLRRRLQQRPRLGDVQRQGRWHFQRPHQQRREPDRDAAFLEPDRQPAPLPDRVGRDRGPLLRRRKPRRDPCGRFRRHRDATPGERPQQRRPRRLGRLAASEPLFGLGHLRLAGVRRGPVRQLGRPLVDRRHARRHGRRAQRPHRQHPDARRKLERLQPGRLVGRFDRRQLPLPPVPRRADLERPGHDAGPERGERELRDRHDAPGQATDHGHRPRQPGQ